MEYNPKLHNELFDYIIQIANLGIEPSIKIRQGKLFVDLHTGAKSDCHLTIENDKIVAKRRYGEEDIIESFEDILYSVRQCRCGRDYFDFRWSEALEKLGIKI